MKKAAIIVRLCEGGFKVRGIVTDNHFNNVNAFKILLSENDGDKQHLFVATGSETKTFLLCDSVHLIKNIRSNLLGSEKFVFSGVEFSVCGNFSTSGPGYICLSDFQRVHNRDKLL